MEIKLWNTITQKKEIFKPIKDGQVSMYNCGPTVYNYAHIGNIRSFVFADTIKRLFKNSGYKVKQVINITDVGHLISDSDDGKDKIEEAAKKENKTAKEISDFYTEIFMKNLKDINSDISDTIFPKATDNIKEQIDLIIKLEKKGFAYKTSDGIYFNTSKFPDYGKLGKINLVNLEEGKRVSINKEKINPTDFALWKFSEITNDGKKRDQEWDSPWGIGFPGWHIECSAMAMKFLGETIDIHTGGIDHIPVHHNNEIAQSESVTNKTFSNYWLHNAFININDEKISKSSGNFITLDQLKEKGFTALDYRYFLLGARYSTPMNFTWESLESSKNAYKKLSSNLNKNLEKENNTEISENIWQESLNILGDDLDTPKVLAFVWDLTKGLNDEGKNELVSLSERKTLIKIIEELLGLPIDKKNNQIPENIRNLAEKRLEARKNKDWNKSDKLRDDIKSLGFDIKDTENGYDIEPI